MAYTDLTTEFDFKDLLTHQNMDALAENDAVDHLPGGTVMIFHQANAPAGWSIQTVVSDSFVRVVDGAGGASGGDTNLSTGMSDQDHTHTLDAHNHTLPNHRHNAKYDLIAGGWNASAAPNIVHQNGGNFAVEGNNVNGVGSSSLKNISSFVTGGPGNAGNANGGVDLNTSFQNIQYIDSIVCVKGS